MVNIVLVSDSRSGLVSVSKGGVGGEGVTEVCRVTRSATLS